MNEWISVKDELPKLKRSKEGWETYEWYLVEFWDCYYGRDNRFVYPALYDATQKMWMVQKGYGDPVYCNALIDSKDLPKDSEFVSHWMPLPNLREEYALSDSKKTPKKTSPEIIEF